MDEHQRKLFPLCREPMVVIDFEGRFEYVNATFSKMLGYSVEWLKGKRFVDIVHPFDKKRVWQAYQKRCHVKLPHLEPAQESIQSSFNKEEAISREEEDRWKKERIREKVIQYERARRGSGDGGLEDDEEEEGVAVFAEEWRCISNHGELKWFSWRGRSYAALRKTYCVGKDITKEKTGYRAFFDLTTDIMCISDSTGHLHYFNQAMVDITGYSREELARINWQDIVHPDDAQDAVSKLKEGERVIRAMRDDTLEGDGLLRSRISARIENRIQRPDHSIIWVQWQVTIYAGIQFPNQKAMCL